VPMHVICSDLVRNPLKAQTVNQPVVQRRGMSILLGIRPRPAFLPARLL
jgi:hypothetical protein